MELLNQIGPIHIIIGAICAAVVFYRPYLGLLVMVFMIPLEASVAFSSGFTAIKAVGIITFISFGFHILARKERVMLDFRVLLPLIVFLIWAAVRFEGNYSTLVKLFQLVLFFAVTISLCSNNSRRIYLIIWAYIIGCLAGICLSALNYLGDSYIGARASLEGQDANTFAAIIGIGMLLVILIIRPNFKKYKVLIPYGIGILFIYGLVIGASRTAVVAMSMALFVYLLLNRNRLKNLANILIIFLLLSTVLIVGLQKGLIRQWTLNRIESTTSYEETTLSGRFWIWSVGCKMINDNFIIGVGLDNFNATFNKYTGEGWGPHNTYISIFAETGVVGFLILMWFIGGLTYVVIRTDSENKVSVLCILTFVAIVSLTLTNQYSKFFWVSIALAYSLLNYTQLDLKAWRGCGALAVDNAKF